MKYDSHFSYNLVGNVRAFAKSGNKTAGGICFLSGFRMFYCAGLQFPKEMKRKMTVHVTVHAHLSLLYAHNEKTKQNSEEVIWRCEKENGKGKNVITDNSKRISLGETCR